MRTRAAFGPLSDLTVQRVLLGDQVAAAKFGTGRPIDDPPRERQVLDQVAATAAELGISPRVSVRFFEALIEANKVVQRGLFQHWTEHPDERPASPPDLAGALRPQLDRITGEILEQFRVTAKLHRPGWEKELLEDVMNRLDAPHRKAVLASLNSVSES